MSFHNEISIELLNYGFSRYPIAPPPSEPPGQEIWWQGKRSYRWFQNLTGSVQLLWTTLRTLRLLIVLSKIVFYPSPSVGPSNLSIPKLSCAQTKARINIWCIGHVTPSSVEPFTTLSWSSSPSRTMHPHTAGDSFPSWTDAAYLQSNGTCSSHPWMRF